MRQEQRLRFVIDEFPRGLVMVPFAIAFAVNPWFQYRHPQWWDLGVVALLFGLAWLGAVPIQRWYRNEFGYRRLRSALNGKRRLTGVALLAFVYVLAYLVWRRTPLISPNGVLWVSLFALGYAFAPGLRWYYGAVALVLLGVLLLPLFGVSSAEALYGQYSRLGAGLVGAGWVLCSVLDHRLLISSLAPPEGGCSEFSG